MSTAGAETGIGGGPCGACKFLRRKCVEGCIFAPYFESEQGAAQFAAVHRVFGASNASKLLLRIPPHSRLDAVFTLCYEALARVNDPVYGCVAHIFTLQQQVLNLQAELANTQARISTLQRSIPVPLQPQHSAIDLLCEESSREMASFCSSVEQEAVEDGDLQCVSRCFPGVNLRPSAPDRS